MIKELLMLLAMSSPADTSQISQEKSVPVIEVAGGVAVKSRYLPGGFDVDRGAVVQGDAAFSSPHLLKNLSGVLWLNYNIQDNRTREIDYMIDFKKEKIGPLKDIVFEVGYYDIDSDATKIEWTSDASITASAGLPYEFTVAGRTAWDFGEGDGMTYRTTFSRNTPVTINGMPIKAGFGVEYLGHNFDISGFTRAWTELSSAVDLGVLGFHKPVNIMVGYQNATQNGSNNGFRNHLYVGVSASF